MRKITPEVLNENPRSEIYLGDCLEVMKEIPDKSIDLILTDPPYAGAGMKYYSFNDRDIEKVNNLVFNFLQIAKQKAKIIIFPSGKFITEIMLYQKDPPKWRLCWYKGATSNISAVGFNDWEMMMVYGDKICVNQHDHFSIFSGKDKLGNYGHPCPKPVPWAKWIIYRFCPDGGGVLDPFMGSGTTGVACKELGRNFIGIDIEPRYYEIAKRRIQNTTTDMFIK
jgi:DNA modification methylase